MESSIVSDKSGSKYLKWNAFILFATATCLVLFVLFVTGVIKVPRKLDFVNKSKISITTEEVDVNGTKYHKLILTNQNGMRVVLLDYGGIIMSLEVPGKDGNIDDVTLGFSTVQEYLTRNSAPYFGAIIGRVANRLAGGSFTIDGRHYQTALNEGDPPNRQLHGGPVGWDKAKFDYTLGTDYVDFHHTSKDGDQGYPGEVKVTARMRLTEDNQLQIEFKANTTKATPINLTMHPYFNLKGHNKGSITDHEVSIFADSYLEVTDERIPTGEISNVTNTAFDLRKPVLLIEAFQNITELPFGYDNNFCLQGPTGKKLAARVAERSSGRVMEVYTNQPGLQIYTGYYLDLPNSKGGANYTRYAGVALEPQNYPDAPNHVNFPDSILRPGSTYENFISYKFSVL